MIDKILAILTEHSLLIASQNLDGLQNWNGKVQTDNRLLQEGDIFVCIKGEHHDSHSFIPAALATGAAMVVSQEQISGNYPAIQVRDTRKAAALIARTVLLPEGKPFVIIGITGTNGKTTTSLIIYEALRKLGYSCGWIGTLGYYINAIQYQTNYTTPDIIELNSIFAHMIQNQVSYVVMEVSSHALALDRVYGVEFDYCLFSNLSRDHLDFHGDMTAYAEAKYLLFQRGAASGAKAVINTDDAFGREICSRLKALGAECFGVGKLDGDNMQGLSGDTKPSPPIENSNPCTYTIQNINTSISHSTFQLGISTNESMHISSKLIGSFNIQNLALTAACLHAMAFSIQDIELALQDIPPVRGRIERVANPHGIGVFVDYAHTPDAIENLLKTVSLLPHQRILSLIGAGGNRDKGKRPLMLKAALKYSDAVIVSDDNPRNEAPDAIIRDIVIDSDPRLPWWIIRDRKLAIESIIKLALPGDIVLICGKGHENYQEFDGIMHAFDDVQECNTALANWQIDLKKDDDELILPLDDCMLNVLFQPAQDIPEGVYTPPRCYKYISTDTRCLKPGSLFVAIKGETYDGHSFISTALAHAANSVLCDNYPEHIPNICSGTLRDTHRIVVRSSTRAMGEICRKYLQMFEAKHIALTGSTGKTSTKEMIAQILSSQAPTLKTEANNNNIIGLCKTILRIEPKHRYAVFELGTNRFGEIANLADVCNPDIGMVLNIGPSHLEFFGDETGVYKEKIELLRRPLAQRFYPGDDLRFESFQLDGLGVGYGEACHYRISCQESSTNEQSFTLKGINWQIPYAAPHHVINAAFAIALGLELGFSSIAVQNALMEPVKLDLRSQLEKRGEGLLIIDCYNANPFSMQKALEYWQQLLPENPHYAVLGDMLELGNDELTYHQMIGAMLLEMKYQGLITVGERSKLYHNLEETLPQNFRDTDELVHTGLLQNISQDAVILIKASHGVHLENLLPALRGGN